MVITKVLVVSSPILRSLNESKNVKKEKKNGVLLVRVKRVMKKLVKVKQKAQVKNHPVRKKKMPTLVKVSLP